MFIKSEMAIVQYYDTNGNPQPVGVTEGSVHVVMTDSDGIPSEVDNTTHTLQTIDYEHHEIHAGSHFFYTDSATFK